MRDFRSRALLVSAVSFLRGPGQQCVRGWANYSTLADLTKTARAKPGELTLAAAAPISTKAIVDIAKPLGIAVHDHIIVGKQGHANLKGLKLI